MERKTKVECQTLTIGEVGKVLGISRGSAYMLVKTGAIPSIRLGERRLVVPKISIERMLAEAGKPGVSHERG